MMRMSSGWCNFFIIGIIFPGDIQFHAEGAEERRTQSNIMNRIPATSGIQHSMREILAWGLV